MYIQVTTKCNMACKHCLFSCGLSKGKHMSLETFKKAVDIARDYDSPVTIGGGEPTLHPDIVMMLGYCALNSNGDYDIPFIVTNGTCDEKTWRILMRARSLDNIDVRVSKDPWHDMDKIPDYVWDDCDEKKLWWGEPESRHSMSTRRVIKPVGRAKGKIRELTNDSLDFGYDTVEVDPNSCTSVRVDPNGIVWADINKHIKIGPLSEDTVSKAMEIISEYENEL